MRKHPGRIPALALTATLLLPGFLVSTAGAALAAPTATESPAAPTPAANVVASPTTSPTVPTVPTPPATQAPEVPAPPSAPASMDQPVPTKEPTGSVAGPSAPLPAPNKSGSALAAPYAAAAVSDPYLAQVLAGINKVRAANGAGPVVWNATISTGSQQWAATLNTRINKDGDLDMSKIHRTDAGLSILPKGADMYWEIIGINNTPQNIVDWWMGSPAHRTAMLDKRATDIGIGQVKTTKAGWGGMTIVVANLAGYESSRVNQPQPALPPVVAMPAGAVAVSGKWAGDGKSYVGWFKDGRWCLEMPASPQNTARCFYFGYIGDKPVVGDWDGDGTATVGIVRSATWQLNNNLNKLTVDQIQTFGVASDVPLPGDWNGDGKTTPGLFRRGSWFLTNSQARWPGVDTVSNYGNPTDTPLVGDWNGDRKDSFGLWRSKFFYLSDDVVQPVITTSFVYGVSADTPAAGDWDGDGRTTVGIVRDGTWHLTNNLVTRKVDSVRN